MSVLRYILDSDFRSNPRYELIEWNNLSQPEQQSLAGLCEDEEAFGIFKPLAADPALTFKVAYKEVALLFYVLQHQSTLPAYTRSRDTEELNKQIARLIMEGILEIATTGVDFVSGAAAHDILYTASSTLTTTSSIGSLSLNALRYVAHLQATDIRAIASRLYCYNTTPILAEKAAAFDQIIHFLSGETSRHLTHNWDKVNSDGKWFSWFRKGTQYFSGENASTYKMYISPAAELLPDTLQKALPIISASKAFSFKTGNDLHGLLRPDKMVVYFFDQQQLLATAAQLIPVLAGTKAQGVPFTAQLDDTGLLSWGVDPPGRDVLENIEGASWRARVTERLASAIVQAAAIGLRQHEIIDYALNRIGLEGIDTHTWTPDDNIWNN